jgi:N-acetylglutamate synthase-like GNAT family acetyltransferase
LCIHSVVVDGDSRRGGLGSHLVKRYIEHVRGLGNVERILLICKENLIGFYQGCGFTLVGLSEVQHGVDQWHEMKLIL